MSRHPWLAVAVAASLAVIGLPLITAPPAQADSTFATTMPDAAYRGCVTAKLGLDAATDPTAEQLGTITELSCTNKAILDVTGTSALPNLAKLFLGGNAISDVKPLAGATALFSLGLENNQLADIAPLASLTKLRAVTLAGNRLRDLTALSVLPQYESGSGTRYGQRATAPDASVDVAAVVPTVTGAAGKLIRPAPPEGAIVNGNTVTYPSAGSYSWSFRDPDDFYFNGSVTVNVAASDVTVPDAALRTCLNNRLSQAADAQPSPAQLASLTGALSCGNKGVRDLTGLNLATGLTSLTLNGNAISDVSPIASLSNLTSANLALNEITSIAALGSLPKLVTIQLQQNLSSTKAKLISLAGIDKLTGLTAITANYTALRSLAPLAGHPTVKNLTATNNLISDVGPLASVGAQLANVDLSGNQIGDLSALKSNNYTKLTVTGQKLSAAAAKATVETEAPAVIIKDASTLVATAPAGITATAGKVTYPEPGSYEWTFSSTDSLHGVSFAGTITQPVGEAPPAIVPVDVPDTAFRACLNGILGHDADAPLDQAQLAALSDVSCIGKGIRDLTGAEHLTGTADLVLSTNAISDLRPLATLTGLKTLLLAGNAISDVSPLAAVTGLEKLSLSYNPISSISILAPLTNLTDLEVTQRSGHTGADLTSLDGVQAMTKLTRLVANNSSLSSLEPVAGLTQLQRLYVSNNKISDLAPLRGLSALTNLGANTNQISDVSPLAELTRLSDIDLATNKIVDLSPLGKLTSVGYLGLKARWQQVQLPAVPAQLTVSVPRPRASTGAVVDVTAPARLNVHDASVRYPKPGSYEWTFSASSDDGPYFSGTITQQVTDPVEGAAEVPDTGLRTCLAHAAGLGENGIPTTAALAAVPSASCSRRGISDLTGIELLTSATSLDLSDNPLGALKPLERLTALTELDLSNTTLTSVAALAGLNRLTTVKLDGNALRDLSPLGGLSAASVTATGQQIGLTSVRGGVPVTIPTVTMRTGAALTASAPSGATVTGTTASFTHAGRYEWPFSSDGFSGKFVLTVTSDVPDVGAHDGASGCVRSGKVWVVVERDTGRQLGGCAAKFSTGLEALTSAGFTTTGSGFITAINGYPSTDVADSAWSYWHATDPQQGAGEISYRWKYSAAGATQYRPQPGSIEGWRFESWKTDPVAPSWTPRFASPTPTPTPVTTLLQAGSVTARYGRTVVVPVTINPASASGTVTAVAAGRSFSTTLRNGAAVITLPAKLLPPGRHQVSLSYRGDQAQSASQATATVVVTKAKPTVSVKVKGAVKRGRSATFVVTVKSTQVTPTGRIRIQLDGRTARAKLNAKGVVTVKLTRISRAGRRSISITYDGSAYLSGATITKTVRVKR